MTDLDGAGVQVLLIATATHQDGGLPSVPSVAGSFRDLRTALVEHCGVRPEQVTAVLDPADAQSMALAVARATMRADTVLLVYFIGHGLLAPSGDLYLAAGNTAELTPGMAEHQAYSFAALREAVLASRAASKVIVLDCCFSGRASLGGTSLVTAFNAAPGNGMYLLGSAELLARAPEDAEHTTFTGALLHLLEHGDAEGQQSLTLDAAYYALERRLRDGQQPVPRRVNGDLSGNLVIAPNPAFHTRASAPDRQPPADSVCPYPGLSPFSVERADVFAGRTAMTERLVKATAAAFGAPGSLILVGASGSGKTSLLNAGLLARLRTHGLPGLPGSTGWPGRRLTPGRNPLRNLADSLAPEAPDGAESLLVKGHAAEFADRLLDHPGQRLVMVVDQLEELFTLCTDPEEQTAFLRAVTELAQPQEGHEPRALVVFALRADFYAQAAERPELRTILSSSQLLVDPMDAGELRASIEEPAATAQLELEEGLAPLILEELGRATGLRSPAEALPLLSHVLQETWKEREDLRLTVSGYLATGGITKAVATTAESVYGGLDAPGQEAVRLMLPRLARVSEDAGDTAQPVEWPVLLHGVSDEAIARNAIARFAGARLLTLDRDTVRISHEALLRAWPKLGQWIDEDRDLLRARQQLASDAAGWEQSERDTSLLYRGNRLAAMRERTAAPGAPPLGSVSAEFMENSWRQHTRDGRRRRAVFTFFVVLALLATTGLAGAGIYWRQAGQAQQRDLARYLAAEAEGQRELHPGLAKQLSLVSYRLDHEAGRSALLNSQHTPGVINDGEPAYDLAYSANGQVLAISTGDSIVLRTRHGRAGHIDGILTGPIAVTADGTVLAAATYATDGSTSATVRLWDISRPGRPKKLSAPTTSDAVTALVFGTHGNTLFAGTSAGGILRWDTGDPRAPHALPPLRGNGKQVDSLAVSPKRGLLASASVDGRVRLWKATGTKPLATLRAAPYDAYFDKHMRPLHRIAFDSSGSLLAAPAEKPKKTDTLDYRDDLALWTLDDPKAPRQVVSADKGVSSSASRCTDSVTSMAFASKSKRIVAACGPSWKIWIYTHGTDAILPGASNTGSDRGGGVALFVPGNAKQVLKATDRGVKIWDLANGAQPGAVGFIPPAPGTGGRLSLARAGKKVLLAYQGVGANWLRDLDLRSRRSKPLVMTRAPDMFAGQDIALSPDGKLLADTEVYKQGKDTYANLFLRGTAHPKEKLAMINVDNGVGALAFSPTKPLLAVSDSNGLVARNPKPQVVRLYDIADPRHPRHLSTIETAGYGLVFSPDGRSLVIDESTKSDRKARPTADPVVRSWDVTHPTHPSASWSIRLPTGTRFAYFAFRPDGKLFALYDETGTLRLWDVRRDRLAGRTAKVSIGKPDSPLAFSPDGTRIALFTTNDDFKKRPEVWDVSDPHSPSRQFYMPTASDFYSLAFAPDGKTLAVVRASAGIDLWDTNPQHVITSLCNAIGDPISQQDWKKYLPDRPYQPPCQ
ncbi:NACHT and WD repeat domain-containing protein [Streptomyces sp. NRRL F-5126]|uniref:NACHT and WD repeat domain-containing protein n=1 Tax=Streptomyces sp. NRRL F-5126 TaxID=1463857 RepID=UPI0004CB7D39|nr:NACHT and WD repeat domain-containing protein [Streptomyces sp. NRRL F-5126]